MKISMTITGQKISIEAPYNNCFVSKARNLRGEWANNKWNFSATVLDHVKAAMINCYGVTGESEYPTCTLLVKDYSEAVTQGGIELFGRPIAKAWGRDSGAKLSEGIFLIAGKIDSAGSVKNWRTQMEHADFEIHDFPVACLEWDNVKKAIAEGWAEVKGGQIEPPSQTPENALSMKNKVYSIQASINNEVKSCYMHIKTGKEKTPFAMLPLTIEQYEGLLEVLEFSHVEVKGNSTVHWTA